MILMRREDCFLSCGGLKPYSLKRLYSVAVSFSPLSTLSATLFRAFLTSGELLRTLSSRASRPSFVGFGEVGDEARGFELSLPSGSDSASAGVSFSSPLASFRSALTLSCVLYFGSGDGAASTAFSSLVGFWAVGTSKYSLGVTFWLLFIFATVFSTLCRAATSCGVGVGATSVGVGCGFAAGGEVGVEVGFAGGAGGVAAGGGVCGVGGAAAGGGVGGAADGVEGAAFATSSAPPVAFVAFVAFAASSTASVAFVALRVAFATSSAPPKSILPP